MINNDNKNKDKDGVTLIIVTYSMIGHLRVVTVTQTRYNVLSNI